MKKSSQSTTIKVALRLRPLNQLELSTGGACCLTYTDRAIKVKVTGEENPHEFTFDHIFGPETPQSEVYEKVAKPVLTGVMDGYNGTIFAYGQTSSGKTFTMEGPDVIDSDEKKGIIPRMMSHLFELIMNSSENIEFNVKVSFLELYNEKLHDLFDPRKANLQIKEDKTKGIFVQDATEIYVNSPEQMRQVHKKGAENKTIAATRMNERSSRSHSIFILNLIQKDIRTDAMKHSKLYFVDLAGSEKIAKTHVVGQQLEEAKNINKSLSALGLVINALTEKRENVHVPYRDSKLTRLLQESLGGNSQTSLILACSMCSYNDKETLSTLRFGNRAKNIKNAPVVNVERSAKEYMAMLEASEKKIKDQEEIIERLQQQLDAVTQGRDINFPIMPAEPENIQPAEVVAQKNELKVEEPKEKAQKVETFREESLRSTNRDGGQGSASLMLLKQQIEIGNLNEEIQELKKANKELETELNAKNQEIYDLSGKVILYEHQLNELTKKNLETLETFRMKFDKLCSENQEKNDAMTKFIRAIKRLKSDLHFMYISKNLAMLDMVEKSSGASSNKQSQEAHEHKQQQQLNKEDLIINSIQKTVEMLEEIEKDLLESDKRKTNAKETEALIESLLKDSQPNSSTKKDTPSFKKSLTKLQNEANGEDLSNTDEELKPSRVATEDSSSDIKDSVDSIDSLKADIEPFESFEDLAQRLQAITNDENKVAELQNLIAVQRKTITNLSKANAEMMQSSQKSQQNNDKKIESYQSKIDSIEKAYAEKIKEYEDKIATFKRLLEEKMKEVEEIKAKQDKEVLEKNKAISDLKYQTDRMQKIILGNDLPKRVFELENKIREVALERQTLFEEVFKLRTDIDEKDDLLSDKNSQIQLLQSNLNTLSTELEILKHFRPTKPAQTSMTKKRDKHADKADPEETKTPQWIKDHMVVPEKQVIKPIRGGGGNVKNFERDNFLIFEKPTVLGDSAFQRQTSIRGMRTSSKDNIRGRRDESEEDNTKTRSGTVERQQEPKRFGELLKTEKSLKAIVNPEKPKGLMIKQHSISEKEEAYKSFEDRKMTTPRGGRGEKGDKEEKEGQSSFKHLFSNVRSFFS